MPDSIRIGRIEHSGITTTVDVEEGKNFRRVSLQRHRLMFGDLKKVGEVHFFPDELDVVYKLLDDASWVMQRVGEVGFERASVEWGEDQGERRGK